MFKQSTPAAKATNDMYQVGGRLCFPRLSGSYLWGVATMFACFTRRTIQYDMICYDTLYGSPRPDKRFMSESVYKVVPARSTAGVTLVLASLVRRTHAPPWSPHNDLKHMYCNTVNSFAVKLPFSRLVIPPNVR